MTNKPLRVAVNGALGRMGVEISSALTVDFDTIRAAALTRDNTEFNRETVDVVVDFSTPEATLKLLEKCRNEKVPLLIGTTGFTKEQNVILEDEISKTSDVVAVGITPNSSEGMNVVYDIVRQTAEKLPDFKVSVHEKHHQHKKDDLSGTAVHLIEVISQGLGVNIEISGNSNVVESYSNDPNIKISSMREGDSCGEHHVTFMGEGEQIEIIHKATDRSCFVKGAVKMAKFLAWAPPGIYRNRGLFPIASS